MVVDWRQRMFEAATAEVDKFVDCQPDFALDAEQPSRVDVQRNGGGTNFVLWGRHRNEHVVFKYYHPEWGTPRWRNERACLQHFSATGLVPRVHAVVPETLIVMSLLPGELMGGELPGLDENGVARLGRELGRAVGRMVSVPLPVDGEGYSIVRDYELLPWNTDLCEAVRFFVNLCRSDQELSPTGTSPFYDESLSLVESQIPCISDQLQVVFHEDLHCLAFQGSLSGVIDLEMARLGTDLMQLERVFRWCLPRGLHWADVLEGYQTETGKTLKSSDYVFMLAMALFYFHIRIVRWGEPDGKADYVSQFLPELREAALMYADYVDLNSYLPHLH